MMLFAMTVLLVTAVAWSREIPEYIHTCKRDSPDFESCVLESINFLKPYLAKGIPELSVPPLEPFMIPELIISQGNGLQISAKDLTTHGASNFHVTELKISEDRLSSTVKLDLPSLYVTGTYYVDGKIVLLPIKGSGPMKANFTDCKASVGLKSEIKKNKNGEEIMHYTELTYKSSVGKGHMQLDNLLGGDKSTGEVLNDFINDNFHLFEKEISPAISKALSQIFLRISNNIATAFPYDKLLPRK